MRNHLMASIATKNKKQGQKQEWAVSSPTAKNERETHNFVIRDIITQLQQVKAALQQATHERFSSRPHDEKFK